jgi:hypothetical protein
MVRIKTGPDGEALGTWRPGDPPPVAQDDNLPEMPGWIIGILLDSPDEIVHAAALRYRVANPHRHISLEDPLFRGTWMVLEKDYTGRGCVYLFYPPEAEAQAIAWAKIKNELLDLGRGQAG